MINPFDFVRVAVPEDERQILALLDELTAYYGSLKARLPQRWTIAPSCERRRAWLESLWSSPEQQKGFVAEIDQLVIGFCRVEVHDEGPVPATIHSLVVKEPNRSNGIGSALMDQAVEWCVSRGLHEVGLDVLPNNFPAAQFHVGRGFEPYLVSYIKTLDPPDNVPID